VDKPHVTAAAFLPQSQEGDTAENAAAAEGQEPAAAAVEACATRFVVGVAQGKALMYDISVGRRPQATVAFGDTKVTGVVPEPSGESA
jgi:hypothetical protein